jgi:alpha-1,3-mannosyltransferase
MSEPLRVVHVVRQYAPSIGGLEDAVANLCRHLAAQPGIDVRLVTLDRLFSAPEATLPARETIDGIPVTRIPWRGSKRYPLAPSVLGAVKGADLVHVHAVDFFFDFMAWARPLHRLPLVASTHGGFFHTEFAATAKKVYFQTVSRASAAGYAAICASSENDAATFRRIAPRQTVALENGVNIEKWADAGSKTPTRTMIFIGRWSGNKRVPALIDLTAALQSENPEWRLIVAGVPDAETVESLENHARQRGVAERVEVRLKPDDAELRALVGRSGYIASASSYEGFGLTIVEGMSAGLLPIVSPLAPFTKLVDALGEGTVIDVADPRASAARVEAAFQRQSADFAEKRRAAIALAGRYAWPGVAARFREIYDRVVPR